MKAKPFYSFSILPKSTVIQRIMFIPYHSQDEFLLRAGEYNLELKVKFSNRNEFTKTNEIHFLVSEEGEKLIDDVVKDFQSKGTSIFNKIYSIYTRDAEKSFEEINRSLNK